MGNEPYTHITWVTTAQTMANTVVDVEIESLFSLCIWYNLIVSLLSNYCWRSLKCLLRLKVQFENTHFEIFWILSMFRSMCKLVSCQNHLGSHWLDLITWLKYIFETRHFKECHQCCVNWHLYITDSSVVQLFWNNIICEDHLLRFTCSEAGKPI